MLLFTSLLIANVAALAPPLRTLLSRSAKPKAREEAITLITEMEREERDKFLDYVETVRDTPGKLARRPLMRYAPVSWPARDVAALDRVLAIGGVADGGELGQASFRAAPGPARLFMWADKEFY